MGVMAAAQAFAMAGSQCPLQQQGSTATQAGMKCSSSSNNSSSNNSLP